MIKKIKGKVRNLLDLTLRGAGVGDLTKPSDKKRKTPPFPHYICLELTNACNLRCVHCLYKGGTTDHYQGQVGYIDLDLAKEVLDQLKEYNAGVMLNGDGESLLHPDFHEIARHAVEIGLPNVYFNTNGTLLKPSFTDEFVTYYKGMVSISLDGFKESHERIRKGSKYNNVIRNIEYLQEMIAKTGQSLNISVAYCNLDQPTNEREEFVKHWVERVDTVSVCEVYDKDYRIVSDQINDTSGVERVMCGIPWETFIVRWSGLVVPCSNCFALGDRDEIILGDAKKETLEEIWFGEKCKKLRSKTTAWDLANTICEKCERWNMYVQFDEKIDDDMIVKRSGVFSTFMKEPKQ